MTLNWSTMNRHRNRLSVARICRHHSRYFDFDRFCFRLGLDGHPIFEEPGARVQKSILGTARVNVPRKTALSECCPVSASLGLWASHAQAGTDFLNRTRAHVGPDRDG